MSTAAEAIAAWLAAGDPAAILEIVDRYAVALPPLPPNVQRLECIACWELTALGELPATLIDLVLAECTSLAKLGKLPPALLGLDIFRCPALKVLPRLPGALMWLHWPTACALSVLPPLPATLLRLVCYSSALASLPPLPAALTDLYVSYTTALPDARPASVRINSASVEDSRVLWRQRVAAQHTDDRRRVAASLPPAALLYV